MRHRIDADARAQPRDVIKTQRMAREVTLVDAGLGNLASVERALVQVGAGVRVTDDPDKVATSRMVVVPGQSAFGAATRAIVDGAMGAALKMVIERGDPFLGICLGMQLLFDGSEENGGQEGLAVLPGWCRRFPDEMFVEAEPGATERDNAPAEPTDESVAPPQSVAEDLSNIFDDATRPSPFSDYAGTPDQLDDDGMDSDGGLGQPAARAVGADAALPAPLPSPFSPEPAPSIEIAPAVVAAAMVAPAFDPAAAPAPAAEPAEPLQRRLKVPHMGWNSVEPTGEHYYFVHSYYVEPKKLEDVMWMTTYGSIRFPAAVRRGNVLGCQFHPEKSQRAGLRFLRAFLLGGWG
jgi:imidazoleglycerol phosphate synthase glutamine amidotransferase subunit HisH